MRVRGVGLTIPWANGYNDSILKQKGHCVMEEQTGAVSLVELAGKLKESYDEFADAVSGLGSKAKGHAGTSKMGGSFLRWIAGSHLATPRDALCDTFLSKVQGQLELLQMALEGAAPEEAAEATAVAADIMICPVDSQSNSTTGLMKRAMVSQFLPLIAYLTPEKAQECHDRMTTAYRRRDLLPVEKQLIEALEQRMQA